MPFACRSLFASLPLILAAFLPAWAEEPRGYRYDLHWGGFHAARLAISRSEAGGTWSAAMEILTHGWMRKLYPFHMETEAAGPVAAGKEVPGHFTTQSQTRSRQSWLELRRDPATDTLVTVRDELRWTKDRPDRPKAVAPVTADMRVGVLDPLSAMHEFGRRARDGAGEFTLKVFDGRQRYDVKAKVKGMGRQRDGERVLDGILVEVGTVPIAGFRESMQSVWDGATFTVLVDPASGLPLRIVADTFIAAAVIVAVEPCVTADDCRPPPPER